MGDTMPKPQAHISKVLSFLDCGEAFRRSERGEYIPPGIAIIRGVGTHKGNELDFQHKIATGELLPLDALTDGTRDAVNEVWDAQGARLMPDEKTVGEKEIRGRTVDSAVRLVSKYHNEFAPNIDPARVERPWVLHLKSCDYDLAGQIDLDEVISEQLPTGRITDWKTSAKSPTADMAHRSIQLSLYAMAKKALDGVIPKVALHYLVDLKKEPKIVPLESERTERHFRTVFNHLTTVFDAWKKGIFIPCNPNFWKCSDLYCGYHSSCRYVHH